MGRAKNSEQLPTDWKEQLKNIDKEEAAKEFTLVVEQSQAIPLGSRAQYPLYLEARALHLLRAMAKMDGVSAQQLIRDCLDKLIDSRVYRVQKKKRASKKKRSARS